MLAAHNLHLNSMFDGEYTTTTTTKIITLEHREDNILYTIYPGNIY